MAIGTGLPIPKDDQVRPQPSNVVGAGAFSVAQSWLNIAQSAQQSAAAAASERESAEKITNTGVTVARDALEAYQYQEKQAQVAKLADFEVDWRKKRIEARDKFTNDPEGFRTWAEESTAGALGQVPAWMLPHAKQFLSREFEGAYSAILGERRAQDKRLETQSITARLRDAETSVMSAADTLGFHTPQGKAALAEHEGVLRAAVNSNLIAPDEADRRILNLTNRATAADIVRTIGAEYRERRANGDIAGPEALKIAEDRILRNPDLILSEQDRYAYYHKATAEIRAGEAERKQDLREAKLAATDAMSAMSRGVLVSPEVVDGIAKQLQSAGGQAEVARLRAAQTRATELDAFNKLPLQEQTRQLQNVSATAAASSGQAQAAYQFFTSRGYTPAQASGIVGNLIQEGANLDPTRSHDSGTGIGIAGWRLERRAALEQFAAARGKPVTDFNTQLEFIDHELKNSPTEARAAEALRNAKTPAEAAAAFLHYERPAGYTPDRPLAGHGASNRVANARAVSLAAGNAPEPGDERFVAGPGVDFRTVSAQQSVLGKRANEMWADMEKGLGEGIRPHADALDAVTQAATLAGDHNLLERIGQRVGRFDAAAALQQRPLAEQQAALTEIERAGADTGLNPGAAAWKKDVEARYAATQKGLAENPVQFTVTQFPNRFATPAPLNPANPEAFRAGLAQRARIAAFAAENWRVPPMQALDSGDLTALQATLQAADPATKARIYSDITATLPAELRIATLAKLGERGGDGMVGAYAGALFGAAPDIASSILRGQTAMKADERTNPFREGENKATVNDAMDKVLPPAAFSLENRTDPNGAYATMRNAVIARYADLTAQDPAAKNEFSDTRLQQAANDVTGGILTHNGSKFIAPKRGMTQAQFDSVLWSLTDRDLAGMTTASGTPVTADYLRSNGRLESVGDGRYQVQLGTNPLKPIYAFKMDPSGAEMPRAYVLDLRNRPANLTIFDPFAGPSNVPGF